MPAIFIRQPISIGSLLLDVSNYRITKQTSQKAARDAIIAVEDKKLLVLARDIIELGLSPIDTTMVIDAGDGNGNYIVIEGNRRLTAINLMLKPEQCEGTSLYAAFKKLNKDHSDSIPKVLDCVIAPSKTAGLVWINRKHQTGLQGAGTEQWSSMANARADAEQGISRPELDVVNFVLTNPNLDVAIKDCLTGSDFPITTLQRLVETKEVQDATGFSFQSGKLISDQDKDRVQGVLTEMVTVIATGKNQGEKFTVRDIDTQPKRAVFIGSIVGRHPPKKKSKESWVISGTPVTVKKKVAKPAVRSTASTGEQLNLIPKSFKLELPAGKVNDIFIELKELDVTKRRHAVSVLFRVFIEFSLDAYIQKHGIQLPKDANGHVIDKLKIRLQHVAKHVKDSKLLNEKEMKPVNVAISSNDSLLAPDTLNAYVHGQWMNPDPLQLKLSWANIQLFLERLWKA